MYGFGLQGKRAYVGVEEAPLVVRQRADGTAEEVDAAVGERARELVVVAALRSPNSVSSK